MKGIPRPSPAMIVAIVALIVAIGGTAVALPGRFSVTRDDLRANSIGARALGKMVVGRSLVMRSKDPIAGDGVLTEAEGAIVCPPRAPTAIDPSISGMGPTAFEINRNAMTNRFGAPRGYRFAIKSDDGPGIGYTMKVNCLFTR